VLCTVQFVALSVDKIRGIKGLLARIAVESKFRAGKPEIPTSVASPIKKMAMV